MTPYHLPPGSAAEGARRLAAHLEAQPDVTLTLRLGVAPTRVEFYARLDVSPLGTVRPDEAAGSIEGVADLGGPELALLERAYRDQTPITINGETEVYVTELGYALEPEE